MKSKSTLSWMFIAASAIVGTISASPSPIKTTHFNCADQATCIKSSLVYDACTDVYTICLYWDLCESKESITTIDHICSSALGTANCIDTNPWANCMKGLDDWSSSVSVCVEARPLDTIYFGIRDHAGPKHQAPNNPHNYTLDGGLNGTCIADTSSRDYYYTDFMDCNDGKDGTALWRFYIPDSPEDSVCSTSTTTACPTTTETFTEAVTETFTKIVTSTKTKTKIQEITEIITAIETDIWPDLPTDIILPEHVTETVTTTTTTTVTVDHGVVSTSTPTPTSVPISPIS